MKERDKSVQKFWTQNEQERLILNLRKQTKVIKIIRKNENEKESRRTQRRKKI